MDCISKSKQKLLLHFMLLMEYKNQKFKQRRQKLQALFDEQRSRIIKYWIMHLTTNYYAISSSIVINKSIEMCKFNRSEWMKPRSADWWERIVLLQFDDTRWIENFRMKKETFFKFCNLIRPNLEPKVNILISRKPISAEKQIAIAIYKLASCAEYRTVGELFGVHKSSVKKCLYNVVKEINSKLLLKYIFMPNASECLEIAENFENITKIPCIIGCIDGTHIPVKAPKEGYCDFRNRKGWASYNLQAVVDCYGRFRNIFCKFPGNVHDAYVFKESSLYKRWEDVIPQERRSFNGIEIPFMLIGDPAYPLLPWVMKSYVGCVTAEEDSFNAYLNEGRVKVEHSFGRLKGRWRMLSRQNDIYHEFMPYVISACCILHNFVEEEQMPYWNQWMNDVQVNNTQLPQPALQMGSQQISIMTTGVRNSLKQYLANNYPLRTSNRLNRF